MSEKATKSALDLLEESLEILPEVGPAARADVWTLIRFTDYKVNFLEDVGLSWRGESFKNSGRTVLLVVRVLRGKTPLVAFVTERDTIGCMTVFLRKLEEDTLNWVPDKYG